MSLLLEKTQNAFAKAFAVAPQYTVRAPGRVNLIGEHTDYNDGFVLPCAINFHSLVCANPRQDRIVRVIALNYELEQDEFSLDAPIEPVQKQWANYVRGVVKVLVDRGYEFNGADIAVCGNIPQGTGLSSSASLEVVIGQTFKALYNLDISQQDVALIGQEAENKFVGCNCGIMDQLISAKAEQGHASLIDCKTLELSSVSIPEGLSIVIVNSNKQRGLVDSEYNTRRQQCEAASAYFGVKSLREVDLATLEAGIDGLEPVIAKRARHVVTENQRVLEAVEAMNNGNIHKLQALMAASHASMRDDFEITVFEIDTLVDIIKEAVGTQGGVRMTGGGFGGCVVSLIPDELVATVVKTIKDKYPAATGLTPDVFVCSAEAGAGELKE
ncbi:galactokinase [Parashewanella curva]|uniref:Galactokinase n=1 Tax=Parashewanella curva TaxID=2338552 RepID=A0A3L8PZL8_9GAMM|nr:galactokinase [Parashewanella curva]RLV60916.1 galactokinase [Parashewanella curva]